MENHLWQKTYLDKFTKMNDLQRGADSLHSISAKYSMAIFPGKAKTMGFIETPAVINNKTLQQVNRFRYLGYDISFNCSKSAKRQGNNTETRNKISQKVKGST